MRKLDNGVKCLYTNTDVLNNKLEEMQIFVEKEKIQFVAITETLSKTGVECEEIFILPGFECVSCCSGRGVALFIKKGVEYCKLSDYEHIFSPSIVCDIKLPGVENFILSVIYRSPNCNDVDNENLNNFISHMCQNHGKNKIIIMGDFNFPDIDWTMDISNKSEEHIASKFLSCTHENYLNQIVNSPTHFRGTQNPTLIDLILTNEADLVQDVDFHPPFGKSHHVVLTFSIDLNPTVLPNVSVLKYQMNKADYGKMRSHLRQFDWDEVTSDDKPLDNICEDLVCILDTAKDKFVPKRLIKQNNPVRRTFTAPVTLLSALQLKRAAFARKKKYRSDINEAEYVKYRNLVNKLVKKAKREKEKNVAKEAKSNPKALFQYISSKTKTRENVPNLEKQDGTLTKNDAEKVEVLSQFFKSVYTKEDTTNIPEFERRTSNTLSSVSVTTDDIRCHLKSLNVNKSSGPDGVHPRLLKECAEELAYPLKRLFDRTMKEGKIPVSWKIQEVRPIFKKGKKSVPGNYRPVSLTSILCKMFETFIRRALYTHLVNNKLLSESQFGFCQGRSCVSQLLITLSEWLADLDNNLPVDVAYLDFKKAFDSVPHQRLLKKLEGYGITGNIYSWIEDFLKDRTQFVSINGTKSERVPVTSGVPQGSVLGPTLFIYFINDLPSVTQCRNKIFADDTKPYQAIKSVSDQITLQVSIDDMVDWSVRWLLFFNGDKCSILHLGRNNPKYDYTIKHGDSVQSLRETISEKDLGVFMDPLLNFNFHITNQIKKARGVAAMILRAITSRSSDILIPLYIALVRPNLEYANVVWSPYLKKDKQRLENVQRHFTKRISGLSTLSYTDRLRILNLPSLEYRRLRGDLIEAYKITNNIYDPLTTHKLFCFDTDKRTRSHPFKMHKTRFNTTKYQHFFTNRIVNTWNSLPEHMVMSDSLNTFKNKVDVHFHKYRFTQDIEV